MNNLDDILSTARELADVAGKKANETVEISKLKWNNVRLNGQIQKCYEKLGAFAYKMAKNGEANQELIDLCIEEIDNLTFQVEQNEEKIQENRGKSKCPLCGALNAKNAVYCMKCGEKIPVKNTGDGYVEMDLGVVEEQDSDTGDEAKDEE